MISLAFSMPSSQIQYWEVSKAGDSNAYTLNWIEHEIIALLNTEYHCLMHLPVSMMHPWGIMSFDVAHVV